MKIIIIGLGIQGYKRLEIADADCVATVDNANSEASYRTIQEVPLDIYDSVILCTPDQPKFDIFSCCCKYPISMILCLP